MDFATPGVFAKTRVRPDDTFGSKLEIKSYESRHNSYGNRTRLEAGTRRTETPPKDADHNSALVQTRYYDYSGDLSYTDVEVRSPYMKTALRKVIKEYPGMAFKTNKIIFRDEPRCIFHYRRELQAYGMSLDDELATKHLIFLLNYMYNTLNTQISSYYAYMESPSTPPGIEFDNLWTAFRPGDLIYMLDRNIHRVLTLKSMEKCWMRWQLELEKIANDGTSFGFAIERVTISWYDGYKPLNKLDAFPLEYHPQKRADIPGAEC